MRGTRRPGHGGPVGRPTFSAETIYNILSVTTRTEPHTKLGTTRTLSMLTVTLCGKDVSLFLLDT